MNPPTGIIVRSDQPATGSCKSSLLCVIPQCAYRKLQRLAAGIGPSSLRLLVSTEREKHVHQSSDTICLSGVISSGCSTGRVAAQDSNGGQFPVQYNGRLEGAENVYLYSPQLGWRQLPVVCGGKMPARSAQSADQWRGSSSQCSCPCESSVQRTGYRELWVPLNDVHLYQNDPRFRVVTPMPKEPPVALKMPPKPERMP